MKKKPKKEDVEATAEKATIDELRGALQKLGSIGGKKSARALTAKERKERATRASHARKVWRDTHPEK
jgi:hypothetical protein